MDLDGTIATYDGWKGVEHIGDPRPGAGEFLATLREQFRVVIYTTRTNPAPGLADDGRDGRTAADLVAIVTAWLHRHALPFDAVYAGPGKPLAEVYIDDRAVPVPANPGPDDYARVLAGLSDRTVFAAADADPPPANGKDFALPGPTGKSVARLLADAVTAGRVALADALRTAVARRVRPDGSGVRTTAPLFDESERQTVAAALERAVVAADLLGRARVQRYADAVRETGRAAFAADVLADLTTLPKTSRAALDYFLGLVPKLGLDPDVYGPLMERHAFTLAKATEETLLSRVQKALADYLRTDWDSPAAADKPSGPRVVQAVLDRCGVTTENPQYAEMVFRTNVIDSFNAGVTRQMATPEMRADFPAWEYLGIEDGREGDDHRPHFGKVYPAHATFGEVRGPRVWNCRCTSRPLYVTEVEEFRAAGGVIEYRW